MKICYPLATLAALASVADARIVAFQHGGYAPSCDHCHSTTSLDMHRRRRRSPMARSLLVPPSPQSMLAEFEQMSELMERQFHDFFVDAPGMLRPTSAISSRRSRDALLLPDMAAAALRRPTYRYRIDEDDDKYTLSVELPGVQPSDVHVSLEQDGRVLRISGMNKVAANNEPEAYVLESKFSKDFVLNRDVHVESIEASLSDGVMTVVAPKKQREEPKSVSIPIQQPEKEMVVPESTTLAEDETIGMDKAKETVDAKTEVGNGADEDIIDLDQDNLDDAPVVEAAKDDGAPEEGERVAPKDDLVEDGDILI